MRCHCGGPLRFDLQHLADAARFGLRDRVPLMWKCITCGRARRSRDAYPLRDVMESLSLLDLD